MYTEYTITMSVVSYIHRKIGGGDASRSLWQRGILDPVGEIFYVKKVVIALHVFVWWLIVGIYILRVRERADPS